MSEDQIELLISEFRSRGVLWTHSLEEVNNLRRKVYEINPLSVKLNVLRNLLSQAILVDSDGTSPNKSYKEAYESLKTNVMMSDEFEKLTLRWHPSLCDSLKAKFAHECPPGVIDAILMKIRQTSESYNSWFRPIDLEEFKILEDEFRNSVKNLELGVNYVVNVWKLLKNFYERGEYTFVLLRANSIEDLLDEQNPLNMPDVGSEVRGHFHNFFRWLGRSEKPSPLSPFYEGWHEITNRLFVNDSTWSPLLLESLPSPSGNFMDNTMQDIVELLAAVHVGFVSEGIPSEIAEELMLPIIHGILKHCYPLKPEPGDMFVRKWLWGAAGWAHSPSGVMSHFSFALTKVVNWCADNLFPAGFVQATSNVISAILINIYKLLDRLCEVVFIGLADYTNITYLTIAEYYYASRTLLSGILPEARRRPKTVWALLFTSNFTTLTPAEKFALGCSYMKAPDESPNYYQWAEERLRLLKYYGADLEEVPSIPIRKFRLPPVPTVADQELASLAPLMPKDTNIHQTATNFVKKLHNMGVPPGIDGTWFATNERIAKSINRYNVDVVPVDDQVRVRALRAAHALAEKFPSMYTGGVFLTPSAAINKIKVKYSPGLPFIPNIRDRKQLKQLGVFDAMVRLAEKYLQEGIHPGSMAHCFVKSDIIKLQKLIDGKNIRTIIAADLLSSLLQYCSSVEVTRRQPPIDAFVMNAVPRTEGGFRPFYEALSKMKSVIMADASEFDSKLPPIISVDALAELRSLAYDGSLIKNIAESQNWSTYIALRHAGLINLATGDQLPHTQGLMTGQGNTGVDNRDAFRLIIITAWSIVTGKDPIEFWNDNIIGNAGDDDAIGTNEPDVWPQVIEYIKNQFGMQINIEAEGFENLALVGLSPIPVPDKSVKYYLAQGVPVPKFSIAGERMALLAKRTEYRVRVAGFKDMAFLMKHLEGVIGSAYLTAHIHDVYVLMTDEYKTEMSQILLRFYEKVVITDQYDSDGDMVGTLIELGSERQRYIGKTANIRAYLKTHRWPTYAKVMEIALKPQDVLNTKMAKDHSKIINWNPAIPVADKMLYGLLKIRDSLVSGIPNHVARSLPEFKGLDPSYLMRNPNYPIAKFVWLSLYYKRGCKVPKASLFLAVLKENPYGSAEDGVGFLNWLTNKNNLNELTMENIEEYRAQMVFLSIIYWFVEDIFKSTRNLPILSIVFNLYALSMRDINRLYSWLNYVYFIATGRSSALISNMMPPDPYAWVKQFAAICSILVPRRYLYYLLPGIRYIVKPLPLLVELWAAGDAMIQTRPFRTAYDLISLPALWVDVIANMTHWLLSPDIKTTILVVAPTGTGKSTAFIGGLLQAGFPGTIWLLCPTIVAREAYDNPFVISGQIQSLMKGVINQPERRVKVLTYGHGLVRMPVEISPNDLVIFDEQHLGEMDMWKAWFKFETFKRVAITATPVASRMPIYDNTIYYAGSKRFNVKINKTNLPFQDLISAIATEAPTLLSRALIVVPTLSQLEKIRQTLERISFASSPLSSDEPDVAPTGIIVATTIVDTAVTIQPPPSCLIDFGETVEIIYDFSQQWPSATGKIVPTGPSAHMQRAGRVGRGGDSVAFVMAVAGTGKEPEPRVTPFGLLYDPDLAPNMCAAYNIMNPLIYQNNMPGILRYITSAPDFDVSMVDLNNWALALFIFIMQSDYQIEDNLYHTYLDLKIEASEYEIINVIVDDLIKQNFGDPRLGDWETSKTLLSSACIGVFIEISGHQQFIGCTGICIMQNAITPMGFHPNNWIDRISLDKVLPGPLNPHNSRTWMSLSGYFASSDKYSMSIEDRPPGPTKIYPSKPMAPTNKNLGTDIFYEKGRSILNMIRGYVKHNQSGPIVLKTGFHSPQVEGAGRFLVKINGVNHSFFEPSVDLTTWDLPRHITDINLGILLAAGCPDNKIVYWGEFNKGFYDLHHLTQNPGLIILHDYTAALISPRYARKWVNVILHNEGEELGNALLALIPKKIYSFSKIHKPICHQFDVAIYTTDDDTLRAFL